MVSRTETVRALKKRADIDLAARGLALTHGTTQRTLFVVAVSSLAALIPGALYFFDNDLRRRSEDDLLLVAAAQDDRVRRIAQLVAGLPPDWLDPILRVIEVAYATTAEEGGEGTPRALAIHGRDVTSVSS